MHAPWQINPFDCRESAGQTKEEPEARRESTKHREAACAQGSPMDGTARARVLRSRGEVDGRGDLVNDCWCRGAGRDV